MSNFTKVVIEYPDALRFVLDGVSLNFTESIVQDAELCDALLPMLISGEVRVTAVKDLAEVTA